MSKVACTDSDHGREIEIRDLNGVESGMKRFHRVMSITLLGLASVILVVGLFRASGLYPRIISHSGLHAVLLDHSTALRRDFSVDAREDPAVTAMTTV